MRFFITWKTVVSTEEVEGLPSPLTPLPEGEGKRENSFSFWENVTEGRMRENDFKTSSTRATKIEIMGDLKTIIRHAELVSAFHSNQTLNQVQGDI